MATTQTRADGRTRVPRPPIRWGDLVDTFASLLVAVFVLLPIFWLTLTSFKGQRDAFSLRVFFEPTLANFRIIFSDTYLVGSMLIDSIVISSITILITLPVAIFAAYAFSRFRFRGNDLLLVWVLATQFLPPVVVLLPFYNLFRRPFGWLPASWLDISFFDTLSRYTLLDTYAALIILNLSFTLPYAIWLLKGFVDALPGELEEAAYVDGSTTFGVLRHITFPLILPGVIVSAAFAFISTWNEFIFALVVGGQRVTTIQVGLNQMNSATGVIWGQMSAVGVLIMVPLIALSFLIRRHFVSGITSGAVK
jgi:multiple sugar transport system permease protein